MRYRLNSDGTKTPTAGRGKAEYGASTIRTGTFSSPAISGDSAALIGVTFDTPMPDADYMVDISRSSDDTTGLVFSTIKNKTKNGFQLLIARPYSSDIPVGAYSGTYTAYKLYTDTEYNKIIKDVEALDTLASRERSNITNRLDNLSQAISEQNLKKYGYKIGDYFVGASGYYYYLADLDTFYGGYASYATVATHHVGVVVDTKATSAYLSSGTLSGYSTSTLHGFLKGTVLTNIKSDFTSLFGSWNDHLIPHTKLYNTVSSWAWSGTNDNTEYISALTEVQMYGCPIWSGNNYQQGEGDKHLELFRKYKYNEIYGNVSIWLRSIYSASVACIASGTGYANANSLSYAFRASGLILMY